MTRVQNPGKVEACPECRSSDIRARKHKPYICDDCGTEFEEPIKRRRLANPELTGLAKKLWEANPGEWP